MSPFSEPDTFKIVVATEPAAMKAMLNAASTRAPEQDDPFEMTHHISLNGSQPYVFGALYLAGLSSGEYLRPDGLPAFPSAERISASTHAIGQVTAESIRPPLDGRQAPKIRYNQVDTEYLFANKKVGSHPIDVSLTCRFDQNTSFGLELLSEWSKKCPSVRFTYFCFRTKADTAMGMTVKDGKVVATGEFSFSDSEGKFRNKNNASEQLLGYWKQTGQKAYQAKTVKAVPEVQHRAKKRPELVKLLMAHGPEALVKALDVSPPRDKPFDPQHPLFAQWAGLGAIDGALVNYGGAFFLGTQRDDHSLNTDEMARIDFERVNRLSGLCVGNEALCRLIGSEFGRTANGCHVIAFMARAALPNSREAEGVRQVLEATTWRPPATLDLANQDADRRTATALLFSGNPDAWHFLRQHGDPAMARGLGAYAALHYQPDVVAYAQEFGAASFDAVDVSEIYAEPSRETALLPTHRRRIIETLDELRRHEDTSAPFAELFRTPAAAPVDQAPAGTDDPGNRDSSTRSRRATMR
jgi:hypothetical protein